MIEICILIVVDNHRPFIASCLDSIVSQKNVPPHRLIVVDNHSTDGTRALVERFGDKVTLVAKDQKHSFSYNNNIVFKNVAAKYFLTLNPDTILKENSVTGLYEFMEMHPDAGACGPKLTSPDGSLQLSCRRFPTPRSFLLRRTPLRWFIPEWNRDKKHLMVEWDHDGTREVDWILAACMMLRSQAFATVGYFDERFRLYCEDIDFCFRLWKEGWKVYYFPNVEVIHDHQAKSDRAFFSRHALWHFQSMIRYVRKHRMSGFRRPKSTRSREAPSLKGGASLESQDLHR